ncbi:MAG: nucleoside deaminase [Paracoccaceae bacterium]
MTLFQSHMDLALSEARAAAERGEVPVGAVVIGPDGAVLSCAGNRTREMNDPSAHAEVLAIRAACATLGQPVLTGCDIYVTLEPCPACAMVISAARIARLYYGADDAKSGGVEHGPRIYTHPQAHHKPEVYAGLAEADCARILRDFFAARRLAKP